MFDSIRKHQRLLLFFLIILILPAFVFFGISGYDRMLDGDRGVASVEGSSITEQEFAQAQRRQIDELRRVLGDAVDPAMFDTPQARAEILEGLIARRVLAVHAGNARIAVTDERLRDAILEIPGLRREDGSFDDARYRALLSAQNLSPLGFEAMLRSDLIIETMPEAIGGSGIVPTQVRDRLIAMQQERRDVRELRFTPADFAASIDPTPQQLRQFYDEQARLFETPETVRIEYVVLGRDTLAQQVSVGPDELKAYYEQNRDRFGTQEERRASHILLQPGPEAKATAEQLVAQLQANPGRFAALAKERSADPGSAGQGGDLGFFDRGSMVKPFADAAFDMKKGEIRGPVESEFGLHIIQLTEVRPAQVKSFEQVRPQIEADFRNQQAGARYAEAAESFTNTVYEQSDTLKPAAEKFNLPVQTALIEGRRPPRDAGPGSPLTSPRLLAAIFSDDVLRNKRNTDAVEVAPGVLASARVVEFTPPQRRPFEEVQAEVRKRFVASEAVRRAQAAGDERLKQLRADIAPADAAKGFGPARTVQRGAPGEVPPQAIDAVFRLPADGLPRHAGVDLGEQGYAIYQLVKVTAASPEEIAQRSEVIGQQLARALAQQDVANYLESLKQRTKVVRNPERLARGAGEPRP
jgi:peptidyl-prolyl cis-trans isomerase D